MTKAPRADIRPHVTTWHGIEKRDDYHWLKDDNWQQVLHDYKACARTQPEGQGGDRNAKQGAAGGRAVLLHRLLLG